MTNIDSNRNWALKIAEEQIKASNLNIDKTITLKKSGGIGTERGVCVNNAPNAGAAFYKMRHAYTRLCGFRAALGST